MPSSTSSVGRLSTRWWDSVRCVRASATRCCNSSGICWRLWRASKCVSSRANTPNTTPTITDTRFFRRNATSTFASGRRARFLFLSLLRLAASRKKRTRTYLPHYIWGTLTSVTTSPYCAREVGVNKEYGKGRNLKQWCISLSVCGRRSLTKTHFPYKMATATKVERMTSLLPYVFGRFSYFSNLYQPILL